MKYTESKDGKQRLSFNLRIRLTKKEYEAARKLAKNSEISVKKWLEATAHLAVEQEMDEYISENGISEEIEEKLY